ncbi:hypothetical protein P4O66_018828 [Electrophorus voltai]|uniref:Fork-head domain-containing protein n=1 Tax=Electrophorus voltai TaxID=2609070 RepID=A0AAD9DMT7_9TELE|nr:hypothetical protein P4O66_018828 [Electrophorus voltai]
MFAVCTRCDGAREHLVPHVPEGASQAGLHPAARAEQQTSAGLIFGFGHSGHGPDGFYLGSGYSVQPGFRDKEVCQHSDGGTLAQSVCQNRAALPLPLCSGFPFELTRLRSIGASAIGLPRVIHLGNLGDGSTCRMRRARTCARARVQLGCLGRESERESARHGDGGGGACCIDPRGQHARRLAVAEQNSIRHNLSLHTRFIRVQNEGTGKSSWWMLNPEGGKMGKGPRRRATSMDNGTRYLKSRGRISRKRAVGMGRGPVAGSGMQGSPEHASPAGKAGLGVGGEEFDAWTDLHSRTSSSASTLSGCLSPILAETEPDEPEEGGLSCSASPRLYPSPTSTRSPALGTGGHCPSVELPQLADLTGAISLEEGFSQPPQLKCNGYHYGPGPKGETSYCGTVYGQPSMGMLRLHAPMQTIQENKPTSFQRPLRAYSENNALESLLAGGPQYCGKDMVVGQGGTSHGLLPRPSSGVHSHSHNQNSAHNPSQTAIPRPSLHGEHGPVHEQNPSHRRSHNASKHHPSLDYNHGPKHLPGHDYGRAHEHGHKLNPSQNPNHMHGHVPHATSRQPALSPGVNGDMLQPYNHKSSSLYGPRAHLPSTSLPPNPAAALDVPQDPCRLASAPQPRHQPYPGAHNNHQGMTEPWHGYYHHHPSQSASYHAGHQPGPHQPPGGRLQQPGVEMEVHQSSLDCDVESVLLNDFMDSAEGMDYNYDGSLPQGVGMGLGLGMGMGVFAGPPQSHNAQSWVPG